MPELDFAADDDVIDRGSIYKRENEVELHP